MAYPRKTDADSTELRNITGQVPADDRRWVEAFADRTGATISGVLRLALREFRDKVEGND